MSQPHLVLPIGLTGALIVLGAIFMATAEASPNSSQLILEETAFVVTFS